MKVKISTVLFFLFIFLTTICFADGVITELSLNVEHELKAPSVVYDLSLENRLVKFDHYRTFAPYTSVYKFKVTPGQRYTLQVEFAGNGEYANVELVGENPLSTDLKTVFHQNTYANILGFSGFIDTLKPTFTYRSNFSISTEGDGEYIYMLSYFASANGSIKVTLRNPAISDEGIDIASADQLQWGTAYLSPIQLTKLADEKRVLRFAIGSTNVNVSGINEELDVAPFIVSGRTQVPLRFIGEKLGATIGWDGTERKVTYTTSDVVIQLWIDNPVATVNGVSVTLDVAPFIVNGRTVVPIRFVSENLGATVEWISETKEILITK
jgi:hypothetical protein